MGGGNYGGEALTSKELVEMEIFNERSFDYLSGYIRSYCDNRNHVRKFLEGRLGFQKPVSVRMAQRVYASKYATEGKGQFR
jgi:hypothetical protein